MDDALFLARFGLTPERYIEEKRRRDNMSNTENKAKHFSRGKLGIDQIPMEVLAEVGLVYTYGEGKYGRDNWLSGTDWSEFAGSLLRHYTKFMLGEDIDPETG